jgi:ribosomal-protein-alanine N-acetyltransferase
MIRDCTPDDLLHIIDIEQQSFAHPYPLCVFKKYLRTMFLVAEDQHYITGYIIAVKMGAKTLIMSLAVHPRCRRKGYGTALLEAVTDRLHSSVIEIQVRPSNIAALQFYSKLGFERKAVLPHYYANGEDAFIMIKRTGLE